MVAILILLVGVLGSVTLVDGANRTTTATKAREGGINLSRELIEDGRDVDYDKLLGTTGTPDPLQAALQTLPGVGDSDASTAGWQVIRRGITYTVVATACTVDDPK